MVLIIKGDRGDARVAFRLVDECVPRIFGTTRSPSVAGSADTGQEVKLISNRVESKQVAMYTLYLERLNDDTIRGTTASQEAGAEMMIHMRQPLAILLFDRGRRGAIVSSTRDRRNIAATLDGFKKRSNPMFQGVSDGRFTVVHRSCLGASLAWRALLLR